MGGSIHGICVPFIGCAFHSWDLCSIHGMCVPFMGCAFHSQLVRLLVDCRCSRHIHGTAQPCKMRKHDLSVERGSIMNTHMDKRTALRIHRHARRATYIELESMPHQILVSKARKIIITGRAPSPRDTHTAPPPSPSSRASPPPPLPPLPLAAATFSLSSWSFCWRWVAPD